MRDPTPRDLVVELLRTLEEAQSDFVPWTDGGGVRLMPSTYTQGSYAELLDRLAEMRDNGHRSEWWHISSRYLWGTIKRDYLSTRKTTKGRIAVMPPRCETPLIVGEVVWPGGLQQVQYYTWAERVDLKIVDRGIDHLVATMYGGDTTKLRLPDPFLWRLLGIERGERRDSAGRQGDVPRPSLAAP